MDKIEQFMPIKSMKIPASERLIIASAIERSGMAILGYFDGSTYIFNFKPGTFELKNVTYRNPDGEEHECEEYKYRDKLETAERLIRESSLRF